VKIEVNKQSFISSTDTKFMYRSSRRDRKLDWPVRPLLWKQSVAQWCSVTPTMWSDTTVALTFTFVSVCASCYYMLIGTNMKRELPSLVTNVCSEIQRGVID